MRHAWQPHRGFRTGRIRNVAIDGTGCDYVLLLDGDMVAHPDFVADHLALARPGHYSQGVCILLDPPATARLLHRAANGLVALKSCNQGFWRDDLLAVNGFDEQMTGWGAEDKELCACLATAGIRRQTLLVAAIAWHLGQAPAARAAADSNRARWQETVSRFSRLVRATRRCYK